MPLSLVAALADAEEVAFSVVRDAIGVSDPTLSRHASLLEAAGYVQIRKGHVGKRPRTWLSLTPLGRRALDRHLQALNEIVARVPPSQA
ncbi:MAG: winged helix-turn-helix domain-containing protein, partial [Acidimicrobiales bacterium]